MKPIKWITHLLLALFIISGCTFQKRLYRDGFYFHKKSDHQDKKEQVVKTFVPLPQIASKPFTDPIIASSVDKLIILPKKLPDDSLKHICKDSICMKNGYIILADVKEVTETEVKFKRCDGEFAGDYIVHKNEIEKIKYRDGKLEHFKDHINVSRKDRTTTDLAGGGFIWAIAGLIIVVVAIGGILIAVNGIEVLLAVIAAFFLGIVANICWINGIILGSTALSRMDKVGKDMKGKRLALVSVLVPIVFFILLILATVVSVLLEF